MVATKDEVLSDEEDVRDDITGNLLPRDRLMRLKESGSALDHIMFTTR